MTKTKTKSHAHHVRSNKSVHRTHKSEAKTAVKKSRSRSSDSLKNIALIVLLIALVAVVAWAFNNGMFKGLESSPKTKTTTTGEHPTVAAGDFNIPAEIKAKMKTLADDDPYIGAEDAPVVMVEFSDFQCPFCSRFKEQAMGDIIKNFVDTGVVKLVFRDLPLPFHPHSQKAAEAAECAHEQGKFWEFHDKLFENQQALGVENYKKYAADLGLDMEQFNDCLDSDKYLSETQEDAKAAAEEGIGGTPGFVINGQVVSGAQPYDKFEQVICSIVPESQPCKDVPPPVEFTITIVNDERCPTCDVSGLKTALSENLFPGATFKEVDASSDEGKALIEENDLTFAPSFLFDAKVAETNSWKNDERLRTAFVKSGDGYKLIDEATGSSWFFSDEKRQAQAKKLSDALGLETGDNKPQVDFFVMSYCPYGNQAEELLKPVFDKLKGKADFNPRYVIYTQGTGCYTDDDGTQLCSLHGAAELNEDVRELCVYNNYGEQEWFDFALAMNSKCDYKNADTCWTDVAKDLGLDTDMIETCFNENKVKYAREQYELNKMLGVRGSPTLFFEGEKYAGARSSNGYLSAICAGFDDAPAECSEAVEEATPSNAGSQAGCGA